MGTTPNQVAETANLIETKMMTAVGAEVVEAGVVVLPAEGVAAVAVGIAAKTVMIITITIRVNLQREYLYLTFWKKKYPVVQAVLVPNQIIINQIKIMTKSLIRHLQYQHSEQIITEKMAEAETKVTIETIIPMANNVAVIEIGAQETNPVKIMILEVNTMIKSRIP